MGLGVFLEEHILDLGIVEMYKLKTETSRKKFYIRCIEQNGNLS